MKFRKMTGSVELPEKINPELYINVRSNKRIDVRSGENIAIPTGVEISVAKGETVVVSGPNVVRHIIEPCRYTELFVMVHNPGDRAMLVYPGQVLASVSIVKAKKKVAASKTSTRKPRTRKTTLTSSAKMSNSPGLHTKKPCTNC